MKIKFTRIGYAVGISDKCATLEWERIANDVPRVGDSVTFDDPESPFQVTGVTWNYDGDPDVQVTLR
jgi:hypothetical protein